MDGGGRTPRSQSLPEGAASATATVMQQSSCAREKGGQEGRGKGRGREACLEEAGLVLAQGAVKAEGLEEAEDLAVGAVVDKPPICKEQYVVKQVDLTPLRCVFEGQGATRKGGGGGGGCQRRQREGSAGGGTRECRVPSCPSPPPPPKKSNSKDPCALGCSQSRAGAAGG